MNTAIDKLQNLQEQMEAIRKTLQEEGQSLIRQAAQEIFDEHPTLHQIRWCQYTPWFNDGDACVFRVSDVTFLTKEDYDRGDLDDVYETSKGTPALSAAVRALEKAIEDLDDDMKLIFSDHVLVRLTRQEDKVEVEVEEYSHE